MRMFYIVILMMTSAHSLAAEFTKHLGTWVVNYDMTLKTLEESKLSSTEKAKYKEEINLLRLTGGAGLTFRADTAAEFSGMRPHKSIPFHPYEIEVIDDRTIRTTFKDANKHKVSKGIIRFDGDCFYTMEKKNKEPKLKEYYCKVTPNADEEKLN